MRRPRVSPTPSGSIVATRWGRGSAAARTGAGPTLRASGVVELQHEGATGDDADTAGQEISADDVLEDAAFAGALGADDDDLREVNGRLSDGAEHILELVDDGDQVLHRHLCVLSSCSSLFCVVGVRFGGGCSPEAVGGRRGGGGV